MTTDEFSLLAEEAAEFGIAWTGQPAVERLTFTTSEGRAVSAIRWGTAEPEVVLLHGGGLNAHTWDATALALGRPLLALDMPGHGHSDWHPGGDYRPETNAIAVAEVIDALAPSAQAVVGQSLGGLTAIAVSGNRPDLVRSAVIVDVSPGLKIGDAAPVRDFLAGADSFATREEIVDRALAFGIGRSATALARGVIHNTKQRDDGRYVFRHHLISLPPDAPALLDFTPLWPAAEAMQGPVLLVRASKGFLSPDVVDEFVARVPNAKAIELDAGHNVQDDAPVELAAAITSVLS